MQGPAKPLPAVRFRSRPPKRYNFSLHKGIIMKIKIPFTVIFSDLILPYIARNIKKIVIILLIIFIGIFSTLYLINKRNQKNEAILEQYLSAASDLSVGNNALALKKFETVYNSSSGMIEVLSLIQIIDITIIEGQYKALSKLLEEILSLKLDATQSLIIYSKALIILEITKERNVLPPERQAKFTTDFASKVSKLRVPKRLIPNKNALLIGLGQTLSKNAETKPEAQNNELSAIIELIK